MKSLVWTVLIALIASFSIACEEDAGNPDDKRAEPGSDLPRTLRFISEESQKIEAGAAEDDPCQSLCRYELCGYDCSTIGEQCTRQCAGEDERAQEYVSFSTVIGGADTRNLTYEPRTALDHVYVYGCDLWDFSHQDHDGLEIGYAEVIHGGSQPGDFEEKGLEFEAYIEPFTGPGTYTGYGYLALDSQTRADGQYYFAEGACNFDILNNGRGGIIGTFDCTLPRNDDPSDSIAITDGEFSCGSNALDLPQMVLMPYQLQHGMNVMDPAPDGM